MFLIKYNKILFYLSVLPFLSFCGCKKFVEISAPNNKILNSDVFSTDANATSLITGIYTRMSSSNGFASGAASSITVMSGLSADEFTNYNTGSLSYVGFFTNSISPTDGTIQAYYWAEPYQYIYTANTILQGLQSKNGLSVPVSQELNGEAKFVRAFCNFYLVNFFGDVPLHLNTNYQANSEGPRIVSAVIYNQIEADLKDAENTLANDYSFSAEQRVRPNKWAAAAMLSRTYLYQQKWDSAEAEATKVIESSNYGLVNNLDSVFLANSNEAIWQLFPVSPNFDTNEGNLFILTADPTYVSLSNFLLNAFEPNDQRASHWVGVFTDGSNTWSFPYKYKVQAGNSRSEYSVVLRLAEQFLIRAEARTQQGINLVGAAADINLIRNRAGLPNTFANDKPSLLLAIEHERQVELFSEWGHRWLDLVRTGRATTILGTEKSPWTPNAVLYPIPESEIINNSQITQNPGY